MISLKEDLEDIYGYQFQEDFAQATQSDHAKIHERLFTQ